MRQIEIDDATYDRLVVAARLMDRTVGEVVARLVDRLASDETGSRSVEPSQDIRTTHETTRISSLARVAGDPNSDWIPIHNVYKGNCVEGAFSLRNQRIQLRTKPWINKTFDSPSAAAVAVVEHFSGEVRESPNTNGRKFWKVTETGKNLHSIIGER